MRLVAGFNSDTVHQVANLGIDDHGRSCNDVRNEQLRSRTQLHRMWRLSKIDACAEGLPRVTAKKHPVIRVDASRRSVASLVLRTITGKTGATCVFVNVTLVALNRGRRFKR